MILDIFVGTVGTPLSLAMPTKPERDKYQAIDQYCVTLGRAEALRISLYPKTDNRLTPLYPSSLCMASTMLSDCRSLDVSRVFGSCSRHTHIQSWTMTTTSSSKSTPRTTGSLVEWMMRLVSVTGIHLSSPA